MLKIEEAAGGTGAPLMANVREMDDRDGFEGRVSRKRG